MSPAPGPGQADDSELLRTWVAKRETLVRMFAARLRSLAAAEDLVQDVFLRISALPPDTVVDNPSSYLFRVGSNLMLDRLRGEQRGAARDAAWRQTTRTTLAGQDVADEPTAEDVVASRQRLQALAAAIDDLPPRMREAFRLHKLNGLSQAETARCMGVSIGSVEKHISAALKALVRTLGEAGE